MLEFELDNENKKKMDIESEMEEGTVAHGDVKNAMSLCSSVVSVPGNVLSVSWRLEILKCILLRVK